MHASSLAHGTPLNPQTCSHLDRRAPFGNRKLYSRDSRDRCRRTYRSPVVFLPGYTGRERHRKHSTHPREIYINGTEIVLLIRWISFPFAKEVRYMPPYAVPLDGDVLAVFTPQPWKIQNCRSRCINLKHLGKN